ncbi:hypothetical protein GCM10029964_087610 [Kibdelosporangium lantanae]
MVPAQAGDHVRLVAYVVTTGEVDDTELAAHVGSRLPTYMVPTVWMRLPLMPRTRNGKLNRAQLPPPPRGRRGGTTTTPTPLQQAVIDLLAPLTDTSEVPAWAGGYYGPALVTALLRERFGDPVPRVGVGHTARHVAADLKRLGKVAD